MHLLTSAASQFTTPSGPSFADTSSLFNDADGYGEWHWHDVVVIQPTSSPDTLMSDSLRASSEMAVDLISTSPSSNRISFHLDPLQAQETWATNTANKRAELYNTNSLGNFTAENPPGTEEWWGTDLTFASDYVIDPVWNWIFYQSKPNDENGFASPPVSLQISGENQGGTADGELMLVTSSHIGAGPEVNTYTGTGIIPVAGQNLEIVLFVDHDQGTNGAVKLWVDGAVVADLTGIDTMKTPSSGAGTIKLGIYKAKWENIADANLSVAAGQSEINISFGPLRVRRMFIGDPLYGTDRFNEVETQ